MKISEIILESPADIKTLISMSTGFNLYFIANTSNIVKKQFLLHNTTDHMMALKSMLLELNSKLHEISQLPQWYNWIKTEDGKMVMREIDKLYNDNIAFMKKHG